MTNLYYKGLMLHRQSTANTILLLLKSCVTKSEQTILLIQLLI